LSVLGLATAEDREPQGTRLPAEYRQECLCHLDSGQKTRITETDHVVFCLNVCSSKPWDQSW